MKIKEVEQRTGIKCANIRYYEKEGLLVPKRTENNYREYLQEDVDTLEQIKVLRLLGISIEEIKLIYGGKLSLEETIKKQLEQLQEEKHHIKEMESVCQVILEEHLDIEDLSSTILIANQQMWNERLVRIWKEDLDHMFFIKGMLCLSIFPIFVAILKLLMSDVGGTFIVASDPIQEEMQKKILIAIGGFFIVYGGIWAFIEGHTDKPLFWVLGKGTSWRTPGLGVLTNSFTLCSLGIGIIGCYVSASKFAMVYITVAIFLILVRSIFMISHRCKRIE